MKLGSLLSARCRHRSMKSISREGHISLSTAVLKYIKHEQLSKSASTQREWENPNEVRSKTGGGYHLTNLFTATLESLRRRFNCENNSVNIDGGFLNNIRFSYDIFVCSGTPQWLQPMLQELSVESRQMSMKMNFAKINVMAVDNTPINENNVLIENIEAYIHCIPGVTPQARGKRTGTKR